MVVSGSKETTTAEYVYTHQHEFFMPGVRLKYFFNDGTLRQWYTITSIQFRQGMFVLWPKASPVYMRVKGDTELIIERN